MSKQTTAIVLAAVLLLSLAAAWATEHCEVILAAPACPAGPGEVRPDWPLPKGCTCPERTSDWSCWLSGREASGAQDLGVVKGNLHHWRVRLEGDQCQAAIPQPDYLAPVSEYVVPAELAGSLDVSEPDKPRLRGQYSGAPRVIVQAPASTLQAATALEAARAAEKPPLKEKVK
jgi:hypothetical protein